MLLSVLELTPSGRPRLWQGEVEHSFLDKVHCRTSFTRAGSIRNSRRILITLVAEMNVTAGRLAI